jgi:hypothetical protein
MARMGRIGDTGETHDSDFLQKLLPTRITRASRPSRVCASGGRRPAIPDSKSDAAGSDAAPHRFSTNPRRSTAQRLRCMQSMRVRAVADFRLSVPQSLVNWNSARVDTTRLASAIEN